MGITVIIWLFFRDSIWDGHSQLNVIVNSRPLRIYSFDFGKEKPIIVLKLAEEISIETVRSYGDYRLASIYALGQQQDDSGGQLLSQSVSEALGLPIDAYVAETSLSGNELPANFILDLLRHKKSTNLKHKDLIRLWWQIKSLKKTSLLVVDLCEHGACLKDRLIDGSEVTRLEPDKVDQLIRQFLSDSTIDQENITISVLNASNQSGLALKAARLINNIGGQVVQVEQADSLSDSCLIWASQEAFGGATALRLCRLLDCPIKVTDTQGQQRADLVIYLGQDYAEKLTEL